MKFYFTVIIAFFVSILTFAQNGDHNYGIMKDSVVVVEGLSASEIYNSVIAWTRRHDDSIKDHDIMEVKNQGQLNLQGTLTNQIAFSGAKWQGFSGPLVCTWDIRIKDGKFRIRMYDYILNNTYVGYIYNKIPEGRGLIQRKGFPHIYPIIWENINQTFKTRVSSLFKSILSDKKVFGDDDW